MKVFYWIAYGLAHLTSLLPLRLHYFLADVLVFPLVFHILKYRRALVQRNLCDCFPEKSEQERQEIERKFYHWLADYMVETLKEFSISRREMMRRMEFVNLAEVEAEMERSPNSIASSIWGISATGSGWPRCRCGVTAARCLDKSIIPFTRP